MNQKTIRAAVEAMLFAYGEPVGADKLAQALQLPTASVEEALEDLHARYAREDSGLCLLHLNTHWQLATKTDLAEPVRRVRSAGKGAHRGGGPPRPAGPPGGVPDNGCLSAVFWPVQSGRPAAHP